EYVLTPQAGPYVICAKGYTGPSDPDPTRKLPNARTLANQLVLHLRRHGYPAYIYDYSEEERRMARELLEERYKAAPELAKRRKINVQDNVGVLIGGYADLESASKDVPKIKKLPWDDIDKKSTDIVPDNSDGKLYQMSPYAHAFATRNP